MTVPALARHLGLTPGQVKHVLAVARSRGRAVEGPRRGLTEAQKRLVRRALGHLTLTAIAARIGATYHQVRAYVYQAADGPAQDF